MEMPRRYSDVATEACVGKRFYVTESGFAGIGFKTVRPGHKVVLIPGLTVPLVVELAWKATYRLVGDTYVEGIMYGELGDKVQREGEDATAAARDGRCVLQKFSFI
jgi:hypothetical protein